MKWYFLVVKLLLFYYCNGYKVIKKSQSIEYDGNTNKGYIKEVVSYRLDHDEIKKNVITIKKTIPNIDNKFMNFTVRLVEDNTNGVELEKFNLMYMKEKEQHAKVIISELKLKDKIRLVGNVEIGLVYSYEIHGAFNDKNNTFVYSMIEISNDSNSYDKEHVLDVYIEILLKNFNAIVNYRNIEIGRPFNFGFYDSYGYRMIDSNHILGLNNRGTSNTLMRKDSGYKTPVIYKISITQALNTYSTIFMRLEIDELKLIENRIFQSDKKRQINSNTGTSNYEYIQNLNNANGISNTKLTRFFEAMVAILYICCMCFICIEGYDRCLSTMTDNIKEEELNPNSNRNSNYNTEINIK